MADVDETQSLDKVVKSLTEQVPRRLLRKMIAEKAKDQSAEEGEWIDDLVEKILAGAKDFSSVDGPDISISIDEQDIAELEGQVSEFLDNKLPEVVQSTLEHGAGAIYKRLRKSWPEMKAYLDSEEYAFRNNLEVRWGRTFDAYRMLELSCREFGEEEYESISRSRAKIGRLHREALLLLHARALRVAREIYLLSSNGLADGAFARCRTLYEITVVFLFLREADDETARRYLASLEISKLKELQNEFRHQSDDEELASIILEQKAVVAEVVKEHGPQMRAKRGYGWACKKVNKDDPSWQDLERHIGWPDLPSHYKSASYHVHATSAGLFASISQISEDEQVFFAAMTNSGIGGPLTHAAYNLVQMTGSFLAPRGKTLEHSARLSVLVRLRDAVEREANRAQRRLERDHRSMTQQTQEG